MSADNFVEVDHDGSRFVVRHGSMSCEYGDGVNEVPIVGRFDTEAEVEEFINREYFIIEYGVDWSHAARAACLPATCKYSTSDEEVKKLQDKLDILEETLEELETRNQAQKDIIEVLQAREQRLILRANNAVFVLNGTYDGATLYERHHNSYPVRSARILPDEEVLETGGDDE